MAVYEKIHSLEIEDQIIVNTFGKYPEYELTVQGRKHGEVIAIDDNGNKYRLIDSYWGGKHGNVGNGDPWLRTAKDNRSCGEISNIEIVD